MEPHHRELIQKNFTSLVEQTDLDSVVTALYEKGVFSSTMIEPYKNEREEPRNRKRRLYRDIERRGPQAFNNLVNVLVETGHWNLVRLLAPDAIRNASLPNVSLSRARATVSNISIARSSVPSTSSVAPVPPPAEPVESNIIRTWSVVRSTKLIDDDNCYPRRSKRGIALLITISTFENEIASYRNGAEVDHENLKDLFCEMGFYKVIAYRDSTYHDLMTQLELFTQLHDLVDTDCMFVVIASHGHPRMGTHDVDIRCRDGLLVSLYSILEYFNNKNCPRLYGTPKVFVFQSCRGERSDVRVPATSRSLPTPARAPETDGVVTEQERLFSDMLIAHSTIPGFVSYRDPDQGSWYIQAMCRVFAQRAHDTHVDDLLSLVDEQLKRDFKKQTSSVERWGFNKRLYLHPRLAEPDLT